MFPCGYHSAHGGAVKVTSGRLRAVFGLSLGVVRVIATAAGFGFLDGPGRRVYRELGRSRASGSRIRWPTAPTAGS